MPLQLLFFRKALWLHETNVCSLDTPVLEIPVNTASRAGHIWGSTGECRLCGVGLSYGHIAVISLGDCCNSFSMSICTHALLSTDLVQLGHVLLRWFLTAEYRTQNQMT